MLEDLQLRFTDNEISPWGGLTLLFRMLERCDMKAALAACPLPKQGSNRGYSPEQLIYGLFAGVLTRRIESRKSNTTFLSTSSLYTDFGRTKPARTSSSWRIIFTLSSGSS